MASPANSRSSSPTPFQTNKPDSFRSSSPTHPIQIEHQIPNHPHLHIHTIRSPTHFNPNNNNHENNTASFEDELSPPSSISAQILAPFLNAPVPSSFKGQTSGATSNGHHSRGANARANALGSLSRSSSQKRGRRRGSIQNEDVSLTKEYMDLISENPITSERLDKIRTLASDKGIPSQLRKVHDLINVINSSTSGQSYYPNRYDENDPFKMEQTQTQKKNSPKFQNEFEENYPVTTVVKIDVPYLLLQLP